MTLESAAELRRLIGLMDAALALVPEAVIWTDEGEQVRWCNAAFERLAARPRAEIVGERLAALLPLAGEGRFESRGRLLEARRETLRREDGEVHLYMIRDRTETQRKVDELETLKKAEERFRLAVEASPNAMIMVDRAGTITLVNSQVESLFGYARGELIGRKIEILVPARFREGHPRLREGFHRDPRARPMGAGRDLYGLRKDGVEVPVEIGLNPIEATEGLVLASIIDITERKRNEERAQESARLEAAQMELESFSYSVAHDLRAPLRHIDGFIQILRKNLAGKADERGMELMDKISQSAKRLGTLIDEFLSFSKTARTDLQKRPVALGDIVADVVAELKEEVKDRAVEWRIAPLPTAVCDGAMIRVVFANLIGNALKFSRGRSPARVEIEPVPGGPGEVAIRVRDNGVGFDMRYADKLFGIFQRLHRMEDFEGTGIGLANVRRIVAKHGGRTWAEGELGKGASFYFSLPEPGAEGAK